MPSAPDAGRASPVPSAAAIDLRLDRLTRTFGDVTAIAEMSFEAHTGEFVSFLGPSGCGKTTTLSMIAGFLEPSYGTIEIRGRRVEALPPEKRNTGMVFQNYALFPHMSVAENVGFGLRMRGVPKDQTRTRVEKALQMVQMADFAERRPSQLSGGQQQRVALARALVITPDVLLLDEPFGALDRQLREGMQLELKALQQSVGITTVFVTHDQEEALSMSDRVVVMNRGVIEQIGAPIEIYERPQTTFVARFIGKSNVIPGVVAASAGETLIDTPVGRIALPPRCNPVVAGQTVECIVRPEKMRVVDGGEQVRGDCSVRGRVQQLVYQGATMEFHLAAGGLPLVAAARTHGALFDHSHAGDDIEIAWSPEDTLVFVEGKRCP
jgi:spermidine/putrescine ABC transporter ATP-binding subunit